MTPARWPTLSVRQPWAWAMFYAGKEVENRTWTTTYRGRIWIHAARHVPSRLELLSFNRIGFYPRPHELTFGAIIGHVRLADIDQRRSHPGHADSRWENLEPGMFYWRLHDHVTLPAPVPACGSLGLRFWPTAPPELQQHEQEWRAGEQLDHDPEAQQRIRLFEPGDTCGDCGRKLDVDATGETARCPACGEGPLPW